MGNIVQRGNQYYEALEYQNALEIFNDAIATDPNSVLNYLKKGNCLFKLGRLNEALDAYSQCVKLNPHYESAMYNIGVVYYAMDKYEDALVMFEKCVDMRILHEKQNISKKKNLNNQEITIPEGFIFNKAGCFY